MNIVLKCFELKIEIYFQFVFPFQNNTLMPVEIIITQVIYIDHKIEKYKDQIECNPFRNEPAVADNYFEITSNQNGNQETGNNQSKQKLHSLA